MKKSLIAFACLALTMAVVSCKKPKDGSTGPQGATGPAGPSLQGNLQGFVQLYDQYGSRSYLKLDSANVSMDGTTSAMLTDVSGKYTFSNLSTGIYNFSITGRSGYAASKLQGIEITGNGTLDRDIRLSQVPTWTMTAVTAIDTVIGGNHNLKLRINVPADTRTRQVAVFIDINNAVTSTSYLWTYSVNIPANATTANSILAANSTFLSGAGLASGSMIYVRAYPAAVGYQNNSSYIDYSTDRTVYNAINMSGSAISQTTIQ